MRLSNLSWVKAEEYFKKSDLVVLATGSIEGHGRHITLGTDTLVPDRILELIEEKRPQYLIAPTIPYGATEDLTAFPGTVSLSSETMYQILRQITGHLYDHGARRFAVVNGHGGNVSPLDRLSLEWHRKGVWLATLSWWTLAGQLNEKWDGGHGDFEETAAVMGVDPGLVDAAELSDQALKNDVSESLPTAGFDHVQFKGAKVRFFRDTRSYATNGWVGDKHPKDATPEIGREMLQQTADYIGEFLDVFAGIDLPPVLK